MSGFKSRPAPNAQQQHLRAAQSLCQSTATHERGVHMQHFTQNFGSSVVLGQLSSSCSAAHAAQAPAQCAPPAQCPCHLSTCTMRPSICAKPSAMLIGAGGDLVRPLLEQHTLLPMERSQQGLFAQISMVEGLVQLERQIAKGLRRQGLLSMKRSLQLLLHMHNNAGKSMKHREPFGRVQAAPRWAGLACRTSMQRPHSSRGSSALDPNPTKPHPNPTACDWQACVC